MSPAVTILPCHICCMHTGGHSCARDWLLPGLCRGEHRGDHCHDPARDAWGQPQLGDSHSWSSRLTAGLKQQTGDTSPLAEKPRRERSPQKRGAVGGVTGAQGAVLTCLCVTRGQSQPRGLRHPGSSLQEMEKADREKLPGTATVAELGDTKGASTHRKAGKKLRVLQAALSVPGRLRSLQTPWDTADAGKEQGDG